MWNKGLKVASCWSHKEPNYEAQPNRFNYRSNTFFVNAHGHASGSHGGSHQSLNCDGGCCCAVIECGGGGGDACGFVIVVFGVFCAIIAAVLSAWLIALTACFFAASSLFVLSQTFQALASLFSINKKHNLLGGMYFLTIVGISYEIQKHISLKLFNYLASKMLLGKHIVSISVQHIIVAISSVTLSLFLTSLALFVAKKGTNPLRKPQRNHSGEAASEARSEPPTINSQKEGGTPLSFSFNSLKIHFLSITLGLGSGTALYHYLPAATPGALPSPFILSVMTAMIVISAVNMIGYALFHFDRDDIFDPTISYHQENIQEHQNPATAQSISQAQKRNTPIETGPSSSSNNSPDLSEANGFVL